jgi:NitT/TauT family transport system ATP-binding protein
MKDNTISYDNISGVPSEVILESVVKDFPLKRSEFVRALEGMELQLEKGEFVALIGPSGCGKSTVLRLLAGLEQATSGIVTIRGRSPVELIAEHSLGVAFQDHALLPWLSVWQNIALPFKVANLPVDRERIRYLLDLVGIAGFDEARPRQLSGGMAMRVSIARALALNPDILLLDEPFGALDAVTRRRLNIEFQGIWERDQVTTLLVTHSVEEAIFLADRVVVMSARPGREQMICDIPFGRPRDRSVPRDPKFFELTNELTAALDVSDAELEEMETIDLKARIGEKGFKT